MAYRWLRLKIVDLDCTLKDVADEAGIEYGRFSKTINGYLRADSAFVDRVKEALDRLEKKKGPCV